VRSNATHPRIIDAMQIVRENSTSAIVKIVESRCAAGIFGIRMRRELRVIEARATHREASKTTAADSESRSLAMKKFSRFRRQRLIRARQTAVFARIAIA
jgi:hypothetical protein